MNDREEIFELFQKQSTSKLEVFETTQSVFKMVTEVLNELTDEYTQKANSVGDKIPMKCEEKGEFETRLSFGSDVLIFHLHSNVFTFEPSNSIWSTSYVKEDKQRAYCGIIHIYNFLGDSFKYNRENDVGFLVSRIFVNKDRHFFVEGKKELNTIFRDFMHQQVDKEKMREIVEKSMLYALKFDLYTPPFKLTELVTVSQMTELSNNQKLSTSKRVGFRMNWEKNANSH